MTSFKLTKITDIFQNVCVRIILIFVVLLIGHTATFSQAFTFLAPPSIKAELPTNDWVVKSIPSNNYIFQYGDYQLQHVATGVIVHIVQRPDTAEWNPQVATTWQEWL